MSEIYPLGWQGNLFMRRCLTRGTALQYPPEVCVMGVSCWPWAAVNCCALEIPALENPRVLQVVGSLLPNRLSRMMCCRKQGAAGCCCHRALQELAPEESGSASGARFWRRLHMLQEPTKQVSPWTRNGSRFPPAMPLQYPLLTKFQCQLEK